MAFAETDSKQSPISISCHFFFFLALLCLHCFSGFSLVVMTGGYSLAVVGGLLTVVASFVAEHGL